MKKYKYFVSYFYTNGTFVGNVNIEIQIGNLITGFGDIRKIQDFIETREPKIDKAIILYW
jgi:hypothetical protein